MKSKANLSESELLHKAAAYCSLAEHCTSEVAEKLSNWGASSDVSKRILKRLTDERFIDESRYAKAFSKDKFRFSKWGKVKIRFTLQQKRVDKELIEAALDDLEDETYLENLREILIQKRKSIKETDAHSIKAKLFRFASSRGYEPNAIFSALSTIVKHDSDDLE
jgi:regulatory protein